MAKLNKSAKAWIRALRSGKFKQTMLRLKGQRGHCCLGVACELAVEAGVIKNFMPSAGSLPPKVKKWLNLGSSSGDYFSSRGKRSLVRDNDKAKRNFRKIADIIESTPKGLFAE